MLKKPQMAAIFLIAAVFSSLSCERKLRPAPPNELPMYGGGAVPAEDLAADSKTNEENIRRAGGKEAAVRKALEEGWASFQRGYFELAMRRVNQAWLMDPKNPDVFNGFALLMAAQEKTDDAIVIYKKYLEVNPSHALTLCRLGRQYQNKAVATLMKSVEGSQREAEAEGFLNEALGLYEKSAQSSARAEDLSFIHYQWAIGLAVQKNYKAAWEKLHISKKYGGGFIEKEFIENLSKNMPDPDLSSSNALIEGGDDKRA